MQWCTEIRQSKHIKFNEFPEITIEYLYAFSMNEKTAVIVIKPSNL